MARAISVDYTGRTVDLLAVDPTIGRPGISQALPLRFRDPPDLVAGIQQAAQAFLSLLLTDSGSAFRDTLGTPFMSLIRTRNPRTESEVRNYYQISAPSAIRQANEGADSDDEKLLEARLLSALVDIGYISLRIQLVTVAGERADFLAPVPGV